MTNTATKLSLAAAAAVTAAVALKEGCAPGHWTNRLAGLQPANPSLTPNTPDDVRHIAMSPHAGITSTNQIQLVASLGATAVPALTQIINDAALPVNNRLFAVAAFGAAASKDPEAGKALMNFVSTRTNEAPRMIIGGHMTFTNGTYTIYPFSPETTVGTPLTDFARQYPNAAVEKTLLASLGALPLNAQTVQYLADLHDALESAHTIGGPPLPSFLYSIPGVPAAIDALPKFKSQHWEIPYALDGRIQLSPLLFGTDERMLASIAFAPNHSCVQAMLNNLINEPSLADQRSLYSPSTYEKMFHHWLSTTITPQEAGFNESDYRYTLMTVSTHLERTGKATITYTDAERAFVEKAIKALEASTTPTQDDAPIIEAAKRSLKTITP